MTDGHLSGVSAQSAQGLQILAEFVVADLRGTEERAAGDATGEAAVGPIEEFAPELRRPR